MVSSRPSPTPAGGRVSYLTATTFVPSDADTSPTYIGSSAPMRQATSRELERERAQQGLKTWWKTFRERTEPPVMNYPSVFGAPLSTSIEYASVQISIAGQDGALYVWGVIPVVVAKCGLYLKENGTEVEGAFRISGSAKRMRDLQAVFDMGPKYGKNIDWKTLPYTTHDVATIFRRFLTQMPEPIIPFEFYDEFRETLRVEQLTEKTIEQYKNLIRALPPVNRYLLLYVLDLLHVFANNSDKNLMTAPNLALIFQPGVLSHPKHAMRPRDHVLSQQVLEFHIEHQDQFLIGMQLGQKKKRKPRAGPHAPTLPTPASPPLVMDKADDDFMLPSDSDDEAPTGGYYVVESSFAQRATSLPTPSLEAPLYSPKPGKPSSTPVVETMELSDSDEEVPPGGYEVRTGDPVKTRANFLA